MWLIVYSNDHAPLTVRPIYSSSKLRTAQMMIFSFVAMIGLDKCCITSACLQWLCHSGERIVARGPLVIYLFTYFIYSAFCVCVCVCVYVCMCIFRWFLQGWGMGGGITFLLLSCTPSSIMKQFMINQKKEGNPFLSE